MGFLRCMIRGCPGGRRQYQRLHKEEVKVPAKFRKRWLRRFIINGNGRSVLFRLSPLKKLKLRWTRLLMVSRMILELYDEIARTMKADAVYPTIIFSNQWGLPTLSHPSSSYGKRLLSPLRESAFS